MTYANIRLNRQARTVLAMGLFAAVLASGHAAQADDGNLRQQIVGSWGQEAGCAKGRITFQEDGTATMVEVRASGPASTSRRYTISGGSITVTDPTGKERPDVSPIQITGNEMTGVSEDGRPMKLVRCSDAAGPAR